MFYTRYVYLISTYPTLPEISARVQFYIKLFNKWFFLLTDSYHRPIILHSLIPSPKFKLVDSSHVFVPSSSLLNNYCTTNLSARNQASQTSPSSVSVLHLNVPQYLPSGFHPTCHYSFL